MLTNQCPIQLPLGARRHLLGKVHDHQFVPVGLIPFGTHPIAVNRGELKASIHALECHEIDLQGGEYVLKIRMEPGRDMGVNGFPEDDSTSRSEPSLGTASLQETVARGRRAIRTDRWRALVLPAGSVEGLLDGS